MKVCLRSLAIYSCLVFAMPSAIGQSAAAKEFMEASSPLKKGGVVISRTTPGQNVETVIYKSPTGSGQLVRESSVDAPAKSPTPATEPTKDSVPSTPQPSVAANADIYPYPNNSPPQGSSGVFQIPTLGYRSNASPRPSWFGQRITPQPNAPQNACCCAQPATTSPTPYADLPPSIQIPPGNTAGTSTPTSPPTTNNFWAPNSIYTSSNPQPMIRLQNMSPGSYVGQGIFGQPKAYVDGQPIRNLFRYFAPF